MQVNTITKQTYNNKSYAPQFCGVTEVLSSKFINTQQEVIDEFIKDSASKGIAGALPNSWLSNIKNGNQNSIKEIEQKVLLAFRAAIKHLKPYNANIRSKEYRSYKINLENKRIKESSKFLTKALQHFRIIPTKNVITIKKLKAKGNFSNGIYVIKEHGQNVIKERLLIKLFKQINPISNSSNSNGKYSELATGLYLSKKLNSKFMAKVHWGDTEAGYIASEYVVPPKHKNPTLKFKTYYKDLNDFAKAFYEKCGIEISELMERGIRPGKIKKGKFYPYRKEDLIMPYIQSILAEKNLVHTDLHNLNAIIGTDKSGHSIVELIDYGGIVGT